MKPANRVPVRAIRCDGFSLVEVTLALAITVFASASIIGLIPLGLSSFRQAMNNTVESEIVQNLANDISMTDFSHLQNMASSQGAAYYYDAEGDPLATATGAIYTASISFTDTANSVNSMKTMSFTAGTKALITIVKIDKTKDYFSVVVGNNQQVVGNPSVPATW